MRLRNVKNAKNIVDNSKYVINNPEEYIGNYKTLFNNDNPINIEIGMGKGDFIIGMAKKYPNINFIGIEKYESVMVRAIEKLNDIKLDMIFFETLFMFFIIIIVKNIGEFFYINDKILFVFCLRNRNISVFLQIFYEKI